MRSSERPIAHGPRKRVTPALAALLLLTAMPMAQALPDAEVRVEGGSQTHATADIGQAVGFSVLVRNSGGDPNVVGEIGWYVDGVLAMVTPLPLMANAQLETFSTTLTFSSGSRWVLVRVNDGGHVPEPMMANSEHIYSITIAGASSGATSLASMGVGPAGRRMRDAPCALDADRGVRRRDHLGRRVGRRQREPGERRPGHR